MRAEAAPALGSIALPRRAGRFVAFLRNRKVGEEVVRAAPTPGGGLRIEARTTLEVNRATLKQRVVAELDKDARPAWCTVDVDFGAQSLSLEARVAGSQAVAHYRSDGQSRTTTKILAHEPLLLVDNCFSLHALSAILVGRYPAERSTFTAMPAFEDVRVMREGAAPAPLGGLEFGPPAVTLELASGVCEHVWIGDEWVLRLLAPHAHFRVDWTWDDERKGEP